MSQYRKWLILFAGIAFFLGGTFIFTFRQLRINEKENATLSQEFFSLQKMSHLMTDHQPSIQNDKTLEKVGQILQKLRLKDRILHIQPSQNEVEISLQNLSQNEFIGLLESLDELEGLVLIHVELAQGSSQTLSLLLTLKA
ncbi:MAG: hypothetical protein HYS07_11195 [Chlamydiae bacterium]|nr:hypothetical protein [Chlamydiota bacterium]MBI3278187.1 hypothetical protein [Chlamydiota bacterium]